MNTYDAAMRLMDIDKELTKLATRLGKAKQPTDRDYLERRINKLEIEFFKIKHQMEKVRIPGILLSDGTLF